MYGAVYGQMSTPQLWEECDALFADHSVSAELSTRKFKVAVIELTRRGLVFEPENLRPRAQEVA
jgi:hypothetical protein